MSQQINGSSDGKNKTKAPTVYLDANILRFCQTSLFRLRPRRVKLKYDDIESEMIVHDPVLVNPNDKLPPKMKKEADLLEKIANCVTQGKLGAVMQMETHFESWGHLQLGNETGVFYRAPIKLIEAPIRYERILLGGDFTAKDLQYNFLTGVKNKRFQELQRVTGAFQGEGKYCQKQLLDAFHVWCAEHNRCNYFLTLDFKLIRMISNHRLKPISPVVVSPSLLLQSLEKLAQSAELQ